MQTEDIQKLVDKYADQDHEIKDLWEEHVLFKKQIEKLESKLSRTPVEEQELRHIKKEKLEGKTRLYARLEALEGK